MAQAFQTDVPGAHNEAMDPTGPMPSVIHPLFVPDRPPVPDIPPATAAFFCFIGRYLSGRNLDITAGQQTPAPAAGVPAQDGPRPPSRGPWSSP